MSTFPHCTNPYTSPGALHHFPQVTFIPLVRHPRLPTQHSDKEEQRAVSSARGLAAKALRVGTHQATAEHEWQPCP